MNLQQVLKKYPEGNDMSCFELVKGPLPDPLALQEEQVIVQTKYISVDGYNRNLITGSAGNSYFVPVKIGDVMCGLAVGEIVASKSKSLKVGDWVMGSLKWELFGVFSSNQVKQIPKEYPHPQHFVGLLGISGLTAYLGLKEVGQIKPGETLVVSAAAGAVGELVVQFGKLLGAKVVGIAGSSEKCKYVTDLGADYCVNYKEENVLKSLKEHCPKGIDVYFDNVGGETLEAVIELTNRKGRIALCGAISQYGIGDMKEKYGVKNLFTLIGRSIKMEGFLMSDFRDKWEATVQEILVLLKDGKIRFKEEISEGLEVAPIVLEKLLTGKNQGKSLIRIGGDKPSYYN